MRSASAQVSSLRRPPDQSETDGIAERTKHRQHRQMVCIFDSTLPVRSLDRSPQRRLSADRPRRAFGRLPSPPRGLGRRQGIGLRWVGHSTGSRAAAPGSVVYSGAAGLTDRREATQASSGGDDAHRSTRGGHVFTVKIVDLHTARYDNDDVARIVITADRIQIGPNENDEWWMNALVRPRVVCPPSSVLFRLLAGCPPREQSPHSSTWRVGPRPASIASWRIVTITIRRRQRSPNRRRFRSTPPVCGRSTAREVAGTRRARRGLVHWRRCTGSSQWGRPSRRWNTADAHRTRSTWNFGANPAGKKNCMRPQSCEITRSGSSPSDIFIIGLVMHRSFVLWRSF